MLTEKMTEIVNELNTLLVDAEKADRGNKAAARRVRVGVQRVKKNLQEVRTLSLDGSDEETAGE